MVCKWFLPFWELSFHLLDSVLEGTSFPFSCSPMLSVSFVACAFVVISKKQLPNLWSWRFMPLFYSKRFIVLALTFSFFIHFLLIFVYSMRLNPLMFNVIIDSVGLTLAILYFIFIYLMYFLFLYSSLIVFFCIRYFLV